MALGRPVSLRTKLVAGTAVTAIPLLALLASSLLSLQRLLHAIEETVSEVTEEIHPVYRLQSMLPRPRAALRDRVVFGDEREAGAFRTHRAALDWSFEYLRQTAGFAQREEMDLLLAAQREWRQAADLGEALHAAPFLEADPAYLAAYARFEDHMAQTESLFQMIIRLASEEVRAEHEEVRDATRRMLFHFGAIFLLGLGTAVAAGVLLHRSLLSPIRDLDRGVRRLGDGDLTHRTQISGPRELGHLAEAFNSMAQNLERTYAELSELSVTDPLTRLFNRREFFRRLEAQVQEARAQGAPLSLLLIDVDHFKSVNDTHGHLAGDDVLRTVAGRLERNLRPEDTVARYGGEEFAILLPRTPASEAGIAAFRVVEGIRESPIRLGEEIALELTVSVGVSTFPRDGGTAAEMVSAADRALYEAKGGGRNRVACAGPGGSDLPS